MQKIVSCCMEMHEATGGKVQKEKVLVCCWRWKDNKLTKVNVELKLKEEVIKQMMANVSVKTLGVYLNPMIEWKDQHECVKSERQVTIKKINENRDESALGSHTF